MNVPQEVQTAKKGREKSVMYPAISLEDCVEFIKKVDKLGGKAASYASVLSMMNLKSATTKSFRNRISASKQFGLLITEGQAVRLTDLARRIIYPSEGKRESDQLLVEAFGKPPLYEKLIERFAEKAVPERVQLGNILMNDYRIIRSVKDHAAQCFIESADYLGLLENGVLCMDKGEAEQSSDSKLADATDNPGTLTGNGIMPVEDNISASKEEGYLFEIPTLGRKNAKFYIPDGVTEKDIDYIKMYIENMLPVFLDNLKEEL